MPKNNQELPFLSAIELARLYRNHDVSPEQALEACLQRIKSHNVAINAFTLIDEDGAKRSAAESGQRWRAGKSRGPLEGVPFTVKDNLMVSGYPFRRGSLVTSTQPVSENAPIVARCLEAGAVFVGLTTMPEFGVGPVTISPLTGITRNPWNVAKQSGGSSGGAAAGLAAGFCNFAIGSDAGGSIRIPAALTGVVGLKPSASRVPMYPASAAGTLSCNGPLTRSSADAALLLSYASRSNSRDGMATLSVDHDFTSDIDGGINSMRVAASATLGYAPLVDPEVADSFQKALKVFEQLGASITAEDPDIEDPIETYLTLLRAGYQFSLRNVAPANRDKLSPPIQEIFFDIEAFRSVLICRRWRSVSYMLGGSTNFTNDTMFF